MKKFKKVIIALVLMLCGCLVGCGATVSASQDNPLKIHFENENGCYSTYSIIDDNTGVNYVVVVENSGRGGVAISPRYNADGTLYTSK